MAKLVQRSLKAHKPFLLLNSSASITIRNFIVTVPSRQQQSMQVFTSVCFVTGKIQAKLQAVQASLAPILSTVSWDDHVKG